MKHEPGDAGFVWHADRASPTDDRHAAGAALRGLGRGKERAAANVSRHDCEVPPLQPRQYAPHHVPEAGGFPSGWVPQVEGAGPKRQEGRERHRDPCSDAPQEPGRSPAEPG